MWDKFKQFWNKIWLCFTCDEKLKNFLIIVFTLNKKNTLYLRYKLSENTLV